MREKMDHREAISVCRMNAKNRRASAEQIRKEAERALKRADEFDAEALAWEAAADKLEAPL